MESVENRANNQKGNAAKMVKSDAKPKPNLDEIVTEKLEREVEEPVVITNRRTSESSKEKGFSIQRAWCCLRSRRTS